MSRRHFYKVQLVLETWTWVFQKSSPVVYHLSHLVSDSNPGLSEVQSEALPLEPGPQASAQWTPNFENFNDSLAFLKRQEYAPECFPTAGCPGTGCCSRSTTAGHLRTRPSRPRLRGCSRRPRTRLKAPFAAKRSSLERSMFHHLFCYSRTFLRANTRFTQVRLGHVLCFNKSIWILNVWDVLVDCTFALNVRDVTWAQ